MTYNPLFPINLWQAQINITSKKNTEIDKNTISLLMK
jgi:hypothetical protein